MAFSGRKRIWFLLPPPKKKKKTLVSLFHRDNTWFIIVYLEKTCFVPGPGLASLYLHVCKFVYLAQPASFNSL